jgi:hypothetical protein
MDASPLMSGLAAAALGALYVVGGAVHARQLAMFAVVDDFLAAVADSREARSCAFARIQTGGAAMTVASGLSLMAMSRWTVLLFICNALLQAVILVHAARSSDPMERVGRSEMARAFALFLAALAFVTGLHVAQAWRTWLEPAIAELAVVIVAALLAVWLAQGRPSLIRQTGRNGAASAWKPPAGDSPRPPPERLRLAPEFHCLPLWNDDTGDMEDVTLLGLSEALTERIRAWDGAYQTLYRPHDPLGSRFDTVEAERAWVDEGEAIADALRREWTGSLVVQISALDRLLADMRDPENVSGRTPAARAQWAAAGCGVAEIRSAIAQLDALALEAAVTPQWDAQARRGIAQAQAEIQSVLAQVPERYHDDLAIGLQSREAKTREIVARALADRRLQASP